MYCTFKARIRTVAMVNSPSFPNFLVVQLFLILTHRRAEDDGKVFGSLGVYGGDKIFLWSL